MNSAPEPALDTSPISPLILICPHFIGEETESQRGPGTCPRSHSKWNLGLSDLLHGSHCAPPQGCSPRPSPARVLDAVHRRYYSHFRKDSRLYSYPIAGQSPKLYNLLPHPKGPSVLAPRCTRSLGGTSWRGRRSATGRGLGARHTHAEGTWILAGGPASWSGPTVEEAPGEKHQPEGKRKAGRGEGEGHDVQGGFWDIDSGTGSLPSG